MREQSTSLEDIDEGGDDDDDEDELDMPEEGNSLLDGASIDHMSPQQMKTAFGRGTLKMLGAYFQHSSKICEQARFLDPRDFVQYVKENGKKAIMRRGQLHASVVASAIKSVLSSTSTGIGPQDTFIQVCGGTPEACVAAVLSGFQHVIYVASPQEQKWMKLPTETEESVQKINYTEYTSPDLEVEDQGILAAEAVKMLTPYIRNHVFETPCVPSIAPPFDIQIPPLRTYTFIAVTGRVVARTILPEQQQSEKSMQSVQSEKSEQSKPQKRKAEEGGPGSSSGKASLATPKKKGKITADDGADDVENDEEEDENSGEEDDGGIDDMDDEMAQLEAMENEASGSTSGKKRGRPKASGKGKASAKKKPKTS